MKIFLFSSTRGEAIIELSEYFAESESIDWDESTQLPVNLAEVIEAGRNNVHKKTGVAKLHLNSISLQCVGPIAGKRYYYFRAQFHGPPPDFESLITSMDLQGNALEPEVRYFDDLEEYTRYAYRTKV